MNDWNFEPSADEFYEMIVGMAAGARTREEFIQFVIDNTVFQEQDDI